MNNRGTLLLIINTCNLHKERKVKSFSCLRFFATPWTVAYKASPSMGFSRQEYWSRLPFPPQDVTYITGNKSLHCIHLNVPTHAHSLYFTKSTKLDTVPNTNSVSIMFSTIKQQKFWPFSRNLHSSGIV